VSTFVGPSRTVGRIPDLPGEGPALLVGILEDAARWSHPPGRSTYFDFHVHVAAVHVEEPEALFGKPNPAVADDGAMDGGGAAASVAFHQLPWGPCRHVLYGQRKKRFPTAHDASLLPHKISRGTLVSAECCYGAQLFDPSLATGPGIAVTYLREGAIGFMGSTTVAYGPATRNNYADLICRFFLESARKGASLGRALLEARQRFVKEAAPINPVDLKTLGQFMVLGDPSARAVQPSAGRHSAGMSKRMATAHAEHRAALEATATVLVRGVDSVRSTSDAPAPRTVQARLEKAAVAAGYEPPRRRVRRVRVVQRGGTPARRPAAREETRFHILS
jgi:hypothetical protein